MITTILNDFLVVLGLFIFLGIPLYFVFKSISKVINRDYIFNIRVIKLNGNKLDFKNNFKKHKLPILTLIFNGNKYNFLMDTGADINMLNKSAFDIINQDAKAKIEGNFNISTAGGDMNSELTTLNFKYGNKKFIENFTIINVDAAFNNVLIDNGIQLHGVLGSSFFEKHKWSLDFDNMVVWTK